MAPAAAPSRKNGASRRQSTGSQASCRSSRDRHRGQPGQRRGRPADCAPRLGKVFSCVLRHRRLRLGPEGAAATPQAAEQRHTVPPNPLGASRNRR